MSEAQIDRTKAEEGFRATFYLDGRPGGKSIGYGFHATMWPEKAKEISGQVTEKQAHELLQYVSNWNTDYLANKLGVDAWNRLDQRQIDALLSVAYNAGAPGLWRDVGSSLRDANFEEVADILEGHATSGHQGTKRVNLSPRRRQDAELFRAGSQSA